MTRTACLALFVAATTSAGCLEVQDFGSATRQVVDSGPPTPQGNLGGDGGTGNEGGAAQLTPCPTGPLCWVDPLPTGDDFSSVWASSDSDVWLVTQSGTVVHGDGMTFKIVYQAQVAVVSSLVSGTGPNDVYVLLNTADGNVPTLVRWDGVKWSSSSVALSGLATTLTSFVFTNGQRVVWAGSADGELLDLTDGPGPGGPPATSATPLVDLYVPDIGPQGGTIFAMLEGGHVWMASSSSNPPFAWQDVPPEAQDLGGALTGPLSLGVWGSSGQDVWAAYETFETNTGYVTTVFRHYDGTAWTTFDRQTGFVGGSGNPAFSVRRMTGSGSTNIWVVGRQTGAVAHWDGTAWSWLPFVSAPNLPQAWGIGIGNPTVYATAGSLWAAGTLGGVRRWDGSQWGFVAGVAPSVDLALGIPGTLSLAVPHHDDVWELRDDYPQAIVRHFDGQSWSTLPSLPVDHSPQRMAALGPQDVWVCGFVTVDAWNNVYDSFLARWDGTAWTDASQTSTITGSPYLGCTLWADTTNDVWATLESTNQVLHWDGAAWSPRTLPKAAAILTISGTGPNDVWLAGDPDDGGAFLHWNGTSFSDHSQEVATLGGLGRVVAVGVNDLWGLSGYGSGTIYHYDGSAWTPFSMTANALWGSGPNDVWFVGGQTLANIPDPSAATRAQLLHWDGTELTQAVVPVAAPELTAVGGAGPGDVWAGGSAGSVLRMSLDTSQGTQ